MPDWKPEILRRLASLKLSPTREAEIANELAQHLEDRYRELLSAGQSEDVAFRAAIDELKGEDLARSLKPVEKRFYREPIASGAASNNFFSGIGQDIRYALRMLRKSPGFTAIAVLTLALGIGANTAIFTLINSVLLNTLPVPHPEQLVLLTNPDEQGGGIGFNDGVRDVLTYPEFQDIARNNTVFSGVLAADSSTSSLPVEVEDPGKGAASGAAPAELKLVSGSYFSVLGVNPILGRTFTTEVDKLRDANPVAVISYGFWQSHFAGASDVLGRKIRILRTSYTVVGVMPPEFHGETSGQNPEVFVPLSMQSEIFPGRDYLSPETDPFEKTEWLQVIGRLKPGVNLAQARVAITVEFQQMMQAQAAGMSAQHKQKFMKQSLPVTEGSRGASALRGDFGKPLEILMAVVGLILLIACANIANILLARAATRQKEVAVRVALGAGGSRLFRQMLTESVLLAVVGGALGLLLAQWAEIALMRMVSGGPAGLPLDLHPNGEILAFTLGISVLTGMLFGLAPAFRATRVDLNSVLKAAARGFSGASSRPGRVPLGKVLVVAQVALSLLLLVVAGLFVRSFRNLSKVNLGYDSEHLLQFTANALTYGYQRAEILPVYEQLLQRLRAIPGVRGASLSDNGLLSGTDSQDHFTLEGEAEARDDERARYDMVGPDFFSAAGIPILEGREIGSQDSGNGQHVGVINQTFARKFFPHSDPIGKHVFVHESSHPFDFVIIGVAADSKHGSEREKPFPRFYAPFFNPVGNEWSTRATFVVCAFGNPAGLSSSIRAAVKDTAANLPPVTTETMDQSLADSLTTDRMITELSGAFGALALILVCIGLYGIMAYAVSGRTNEIGIRMALGAQRGNMLRLVLRETLLLVLIGVAIGLPAVIAASRLIKSLLFGLGAADPLTLMLATALMFAIAALAGYIPARRAMRVDPMVALRYE
ncbi:MAG TPA: ABC transporter permease [Candidatus Sulfotelmatobacter sp.]|nr:ABC transporter permease [Candidatus Sulfotelmatobacter sp.]